MKKALYVFAAALLLHLPSHAQAIGNGDFENWTPSGKEPPFDWEEPTGWTSSNSMTEWTSAGVHKGSGAYHGSSAVILSSVMISEGWYSMICNGTAKKIFDFSAPKLDIITGGEPVSIKPSKLKGYYKYKTGTAGDSGYAIIILKKWNSLAGHTDTIGWGAKTLGPASSYTVFEIPVNYLFSTQPDSVVVAFYSTDPAKPAKPADFSKSGELTVDYISLSDAAGIDIPKTPKAYTISPNPAQDRITIRSREKEEIKATLFTVDGKSIGSYTSAGVLSIERTPAIKPGLYFVKITIGGISTIEKIVITQD